MSESSSNAVPHRLPLDWQREAEQHEVIAALLAAYVDGELPAETVGQLDAHLSECPRCAREVSLQRQLAAGLGQLGGPVVSAAFQTRIRQTIAASPLPPTPVSPPASGGMGPWGQRWRWGVALAGATLLVWLASVLRAPQVRSPADHREVAQPAPVAVSQAPLLDSLAAQWRALSDPLPGRDRDVDAVRRALGMTVIPLEAPALDLEAVWTTSAWGELIGALAYRHEGRLLVQFAVPEPVLARSPALQSALDSLLVSTQGDSVRMLLWRTPGGASVLVGRSSIDALRAFRMSSTSLPMTASPGSSRRP